VVSKIEIEKEAISQREAIMQLGMSGKKLVRVGGSLAILIPKIWVRIHAFEVDGHYWVRIKQEGNSLIITPLDKDEALRLMEFNDVSPG